MQPSSSMRTSRVSQWLLWVCSLSVDVQTMVAHLLVSNSFVPVQFTFINKRVLFLELPLQARDQPICPTGLVLMAVGFAGLGYAAQRALMLAKRAAPTDEAAAVEAAKVEGIVSKVADTCLCMQFLQQLLRSIMPFCCHSIPTRRLLSVRQ